MAKERKFASWLLCQSRSNPANIAKVITVEPTPTTTNLTNWVRPERSAGCTDASPGCA